MYGTESHKFKPDLYLPVPIAGSKMNYPMSTDEDTQDQSSESEGDWLDYTSLSSIIMQLRASVTQASQWMIHYSKT